MFTLKKIFANGAWTVLLLLASTLAQAQGYPSKPIRVILPYAAGGFSDIVTRMLAEAMSRNLGQTLVVENRPGGGGRIGAEYITKVAADGYQILMTTNGTHTYMAVTEKALSYDPLRDFTPIAQIGVYGLLMVVHPSVPAGNLTEFIDYAKKNPGKVYYASSGMGSGLHFAGELFNYMAEVSMVHVPYKGSGPGMQDVIAGAVQVIFAGEAKSFIDVGRVRFIGTTSGARDPRFPNSPTLGEAALTGYDLSYWVGLFGPPGLPAEIKARLNAAVNAALGEESLRRRLADMGVVPTGGAPEVLTQQIPVEIAKLRKIALDAKLQFN